MTTCYCLDNFKFEIFDVMVFSACLPYTTPKEISMYLKTFLQWGANSGEVSFYQLKIITKIPLPLSFNAHTRVT